MLDARNRDKKVDAVVMAKAHRKVSAAVKIAVVVQGKDKVNQAVRDNKVVAIKAAVVLKVLEPAVVIVAMTAVAHQAVADRAAVMLVADDAIVGKAVLLSSRARNLPHRLPRL
jgi:hypothetical protein